MQFTVDTYLLRRYPLASAGSGSDRRFAEFQLYDNNSQRRVTIWVRGPLVPVPSVSSYGTDPDEVFVPHEEYTAILDVLRNEAPVLYYWEGGEFFLGTGQEPLGEGPG